ncbi:MAG: adenylate cyclase [Paenibacillaceae bacterium]|jgi:CYTH domain-containing protein|nr:adenylate cyclase [Paenibacillaceae bacterium]
MNLEIERKYMLESFPAQWIESGDLKIAGRSRIEQTYLALSADEEIRVRKLVSEDSGRTFYTHTFKRGLGLAREEAEYEINEGIYKQLLEGSGRSPLVKTRTKVLDGAGRLYEIDEYHQFHVMTVEAEFSSEEAALAFLPPVWFGKEVGSEQEYRNKYMWAKLQEQD